MFTTFVVSEPKKTPPKKTMITLVSKEGDKFEMERRAAKMSNVLKPLLNDEENDEKEFPLILIETAVLKKVIEYCNYHSGQIAKTTGIIETDWDTTFLEGIIGESEDAQRRNRTMLFDLLRAANFLDIKSLLDLTCVKVASMIQKDIGEFQNTIDLIDTLSVEIQLEIYSHRTYGINAELADKIQAQSASSALIP
jgi:S-phase kinase-associated protein 1